MSLRQNLKKKIHICITHIRGSHSSSIQACPIISAMFCPVLTNSHVEGKRHDNPLELSELWSHLQGRAELQIQGRLQLHFHSILNIWCLSTLMLFFQELRENVVSSPSWPLLPYFPFGSEPAKTQLLPPGTTESAPGNW